MAHDYIKHDEPIKFIIMKTSGNVPNKQNTQGMSKKPRPEIRDDMDSRKHKEGGDKKKAAKK